MMRALKTLMIFVWAASTAAAQTPVASQLGDFVPVRTSATVLTFGAACSTSTPCNVRFNQQSIQLTAGGTVVLGGSSPRGTAYAYITPAGVLTIGSNLTISSCTGCTAVAGITNFPANAIPLWTWTAASVTGVWDLNGFVDQRSFQSAKVIIPGPGVVVTEAPGSTTIGIDTSALLILVQSTPSNSSSACAPGAIWSDANYIYVCVASGTIKRAALSTF
jgi:hypothetical protein